MSIIYTYDVQCDRCGTWEHGCTGKVNGSTRARVAVKRKGWTRFENFDHCPKCSKGYEGFTKMVERHNP